ncbi:MAG: TonB-dependent receptor, partial [Gemmatimonadota bacterium]|nr:TonB-dependent receptor [Gemmatimonadota bacterium]
MLRMLLTRPRWSLLVLASLLSLLGLSRPLPAAAQATGTIQGVVTSGSDGTPVSGVIVSVASTGAGTETGVDGRYTLPGVPTGRQTIVFRRVRSVPAERQVEVAAGATHTVDIALEVRPVMLTEVVVEAASRTPERIVEAPAAVSVVSPEVMQATSITGQAPLMLVNVPGVDVVQSGVNDFNVNARGFNSSLNRRVLVLQDGRDLAIAFVGSQEWNALSIPAEDFERVEVVRGPGSALYGANAFSGVINIITAPPRDVVGGKLTLGGGELGSLRADVRHAGLLSGRRVGYRINGGYNRSESWSRSRTRLDSLDLAREYEPATDSAVSKAIERRPLNGQTLDTATRAALGEPDPLESIYGSARLDFYAARNAVGTIEGGAARVRNEVLVTGIGRVQVLKTLRPWARIAWSAPSYDLMTWYSGRSSTEPQYSLASGAPLEDHSRIFHLEGQHNRALLAGRGRVVVGASLRSTHEDTEETLIAPGHDDRHDALYSAYGQVEYRIAPALRGVVAARYDEGDLFDGQFSPKAALVYSPSDRHSFRGTVNRAFQTPNYGEFFLQAAAGAPTSSPAQLEAGLEQYAAAVRGSALGPELEHLNLPADLPFNFAAQTQVLALGNAELDVEKVTGYEVGYKGVISSKTFVTLDVYLNDIRDFVTDLLPGVNPAYPRYLLTDGGTDVLRDLAALDSALAARGLASDHPLRAPIPTLRGGFSQLAAAAGPLLATLPN